MRLNTRKIDAFQRNCPNLLCVHKHISAITNDWFAQFLSSNEFVVKSQPFVLPSKWIIYFWILVKNNRNRHDLIIKICWSLIFSLCYLSLSFFRLIHRAQRNFGKKAAECPIWNWRHYNYMVGQSKFGAIQLGQRKAKPFWHHHVAIHMIPIQALAF